MRLVDRVLGSPAAVVILLGVLCAVMWAIECWDER